MGTSDLSTILQILQAHPWLGLLVVVVAAAAGGAWKAAAVGIDRMLERRKHTREPRPGLKFHHFFTEVQHALHYRIRNLDISEPFRERVFKDFLTIKFSVWLTETEAMVERVQEDPDMTQDAFRVLADGYTDRLIAQYEMQARAAGIPTKVIEKFGEWHDPAVQLARKLIGRISDSRWYPSSLDRMHAVLTTMSGMVDHTLIDAETMLWELNGELDGITYCGLISHCKTGQKCGPGCCKKVEPGWRAPAPLRPAQDADDAPQDR